MLIETFKRIKNKSEIVSQVSAWSMLSFLHGSKFSIWVITKLESEFKIRNLGETCE